MYDSIDLIYIYSNIVHYKIYSEGYSIMFQTALTIIKMNSEKISTLEDPIEIFQILQNMPRRLIDCHQFMNVSLFSFFVFSNNVFLRFSF
jgi:hypothetical protein